MGKILAYSSNLIAKGQGCVSNSSIGYSNMNGVTSGKVMVKRNNPRPA